MLCWYVDGEHTGIGRAAVQPNAISLVFLLAFFLTLYFSSKQAGSQGRHSGLPRSLWGAVLVLASSILVAEVIVCLLYILRSDGRPGTKEGQLWLELLGFSRLATWKDPLEILQVIVPQLLVVLTAAFALTQEHQYTIWDLLEDTNGRDKSLLLSMVRSHSLPVVLLGAAVAEPSFVSTIYFFFSCVGLFEWSISPDATGEWMWGPLLLYNGLHILLLYIYQLLCFLNYMDWHEWVNLGEQMGLFQFVPYRLSSWHNYIKVGLLVLLYALLCDSLGSAKKNNGPDVSDNDNDLAVQSQPSWEDDGRETWSSLTARLINNDGGLEELSVPLQTGRSTSWVGRFEKCSIDFFTYGFPVCLFALSAWSFMYISMLGGVLLLYVAFVLLIFPTAEQLQRLNPLLLLFIILWTVASYLFTAFDVSNDTEFWKVIGLQKDKQPGTLLLQYVLAVLIGLDLHVSNTILQGRSVTEAQPEVDPEIPQENGARRNKILALAVMGWCVHKSAHVISLALLFIVGVTAADLLHSMYMFFFLCYLMWPGEANINVHNFPSFSKKALDLEAKIGHGHDPTTDSRKKTLPPNRKVKGRIMFVDNDGSTIELDDNFQEGVGSEAGSLEASKGGVVAVVAQKVIEQYDSEPQYIKGECNKVVDALSRRPDFSGALITEVGLADNVTQSMVEVYREDQFMSEIIRRLEAKDKKTSAEFEFVNGLLFLEKAGNKRLCVPNSKSLRSLFLGECHDGTGHLGYKKTAANLLQRFWWPTLMRDAKLYVETCQVSQRDKPRTQAPLGLLKPLPIPERPGETLSMDFMDTLVTSKSGMRYIYVIVDRFSKFVRLVAMPTTAKTEYVIKMFKENWVRDLGLPKSIVSDRDVRFTSELWKATAAEQGTQLQMTSGNHPEANGQAE
ncbi:hypothetical protein CBR_g45308 [Chara braunii]|uniref:Integrase catalytic domain-containing protein n=1 Tax=Chara braunii TaxID=69332 RepID=A0A388LYG5_CHABU|nr:hypothetical protein CBR_g45308 [Chara braunii]|eukprot:GBG87249.1 hypothetical protein CBR_g45308 [Chara braunii]